MENIKITPFLFLVSTILGFLQYEASAMNSFEEEVKPQVVIKIHNRTEHSIRLVNENIENGRWVQKPPSYISSYSNSDDISYFYTSYNRNNVNGNMKYIHERSDHRQNVYSYIRWTHSGGKFNTDCGIDGTGGMNKFSMRKIDEGIDGSVYKINYEFIKW